MPLYPDHGLLTITAGISLPQADLDFAIPFLDEDIPLYVDPFLLWRSPSQQDQALHTSLINAFNHLGHLVAKGDEQQAITTLIAASECDEVGLGSSAKRRGKRIGDDKAREITSLFKRVPHDARSGFRHFEEIQFFVDGISKDRISDISCSFLKSFLIDFTIQQCQLHHPRCYLAPRLIYEAAGLGINFIDTGPLYGTEGMDGLALKTLPCDGAR